MSAESLNPEQQADAPTLNPEQAHALALMDSGANVILTGGAGTGKSTVIHAYQQSTSRKVAIIAPTGAAASRIGGTTIHRTFQFHSSLFLPSYEPALSEETQELLQALDTLIIDEVSMVRADLLQAIDLSLRAANGNDLPFGGKQVILVGDLYQLPPVARDEEAEILQECYGGILPFFAPAWEEGKFQPVILNEVHRQADPVFIGLLNAIRTGGFCPVPGIINWKSDWVKAVDRLNQLLTISSFSVPHDAVVLCATNDIAKAINHTRDSELRCPRQLFLARTSGRVDFRELPVEPSLYVRVGSRIIMLANKVVSETSNVEYNNGDQGTLLAIEENSLDIQLDRGMIVRVGRQLWEFKKLHYDRSRQIIHHEVIGRTWQFPVKLGYAISIHKSQGQSLNRVHLSLARPMFAPGQAYTALSRCRSLAGLSLSRPLRYDDVLSNPEVEAFYASLTAHSDSD